MLKLASVTTGVGMEKENINQKGSKSCKNVGEWTTMMAGEGGQRLIISDGNRVEGGRDFA